MDKNIQNPQLEDDQKERISLLIERRIPWLFVGLMAGIVITIFSSLFEEVLSNNLRLAYFIPVIVYMAGALGTQTETVYVRNLGREKVNFKIYLFKESIFGILAGILFGIGIGIFTYIFFREVSTAMTVGLAMFASTATAPPIALTISALIKKEHKDPALGAGPFTTVIQDLISLIIYFSIASLILL